MAESDEKGPLMLYSKGARRLGCVGLGSAAASAILVFAGSAPATAHEADPMHLDQNGHFSVSMTP
jgi:hypothetical protein